MTIHEDADQPSASRFLRRGDQIGVYRVVECLGAGGMGEVYRAHDSRLGRDVAIKILPRLFTSDRERLARFEREARMLAALNHPHIGAIYGVEEAPAGETMGSPHVIKALVLELVEGPTLAERLAAGPLSVGEALGIARQIAEALDAANEKGIVHRDLKPANIKVTPSGVAKVLDFGLAKSGAGDDVELTGSPTVSVGGTERGVLLGTVAYMSPEQARGVVVDKRTDIWAFGCVLFEMLTGEQPFGRGGTATDVIVRVMTLEADWAALPADTPPAVRRLLQRCLQKDPQRRLRDIGDARAELDELPVVAVARTPGRAIQRDIEFQRLTDVVGVKETPAVSPDGKMVAFVARVDGHRQIWVRMLAGGAPLQLTRDHVEHEQPRWSPDSSSLIYYTPSPRRDEPGTLWEIGALGGWPRRVANAIGGGDISHDGRRIAAFQPSGQQPALVTMARDGSGVRQVASLSIGFTYTSPRWSPDDSAIAFQQASDRGFDVRLEAVPSAGGEPREVTRYQWLRGFCWLGDGSGFVCSSSRGSTLLYPPVFNLRRIGRTGADDQQLTFGDQSYVDPDLHPSGKLIAARVRSQSDIWKFPAAGSPAKNTRGATRVTRQTGHVQTPTVSPDGTEIAYLSDNGGHGNLWIARTDGSGTRQITFEQDPEVSLGVPKWSPAGNLIVLLMSRAGTSALWTIAPDGSGLRQLIAPSWWPSWSVDGRAIYYQSLAEGVRRLERISIADRQVDVVRDEPDAGHPLISADGSTLYFVMPLRSNIFGWRGADVEIRYARPAHGPEATLVRIAADRIPFTPLYATIQLSPDGQRLATLLADGATTNIWAVSTADGSMEPLTDFGDRLILMKRAVSWSADGRHLYAAVVEYETDIVLVGGLIAP